VCTSGDGGRSWRVVEIEVSVGVGGGIWLDVFHRSTVWVQHSQHLNYDDVIIFSSQNVNGIKYKTLQRATFIEM